MAVLILVTRPQPDADTTAELLRERGHDPLVAPLMKLETVNLTLPADKAWAGLLVSSANAIRAMPSEQIARLKALRLLAVGQRTARTARDAGFDSVDAADGNAEDLARLAAARFRGVARPLLYLAGEDRSRDLAELLAPAGIAVDTAVTYRMRAAERFPDAGAQALLAGRVAGVLHYSRRSAATYRACAVASGLAGPALAPVHYCLSEAIAQDLREAGAAAVRVAERPEEELLLGLIPR